LESQNPNAKDHAGFEKKASHNATLGDWRGGKRRAARGRKNEKWPKTKRSQGEPEALFRQAAHRPSGRCKTDTRKNTYKKKQEKNLFKGSKRGAGGDRGKKRGKKHLKRRTPSS